MLASNAKSAGCTGCSHGMSSLRMSAMDYLQADNEMQTFGQLTGGRFYQPRFRPIS